MKLVFDIEPVSQARPRIVSKPFPRLYDPKPVKLYKEELKRLAGLKMDELKQQPFNGAISVQVTFYRSIQKSISKVEHQRRQYGITLPSVKPDVDNYVKAFFDGLNGTVWTDDAQITDLKASKRYSETPKIVMEVTRIE